MPKRSGKPRLHRKSGRAFIELGRKRIYLEAAYGTKAAEQEYKRLYGQWLANDQKPPPSKNTEATGMTCGELAIRYLDEAKDYHSQQPRTYRHCRTAMGFLTKHYGNELVSNFTPASLIFVRKKLETYGYVRDKINYYIRIIKQAFEQGVIFWGVPPTVYHALLAVKRLQAGKTKARESIHFEPVEIEVIEKTLPHLHPVVHDMVLVQFYCCMRPQDVCNLRPCDIDRNGDVWLYRPFTHKNKNRGKDLVKAIGHRAQSILLSYLEKRKDDPEKFLFSPQDKVDKPSRRGKDFFSRDRYIREVAKGCKQAGVKWTPQQLRCTATREAREKFGLDAAQSFAGHSNSSTTERHYAPIGNEKAVEVARAIG